MRIRNQKSCLAQRSIFSSIITQSLSLEGKVVTSQASIDKQTQLSKPEEGTSQSTLAIVLCLGGVTNSVNDSSKRPNDTESRAEQRVTQATDQQRCKGHVVVLEEVTVGALYIPVSGYIK